jgi:hypothetical protein
MFFKLIIPKLSLTDPFVVPFNLTEATTKVTPRMMGVVNLFEMCIKLIGAVARMRCDIVTDWAQDIH